MDKLENRWRSKFGGPLLRVLFNLGAPVAGILVILSLFELALDLTYRLSENLDYRIVERYHSPFIYTFTPNTRQKIAGHWATFNNFSFRRTNFTTQAPQSDTFRILSYGDSIGLGWRVGDGKDYPAQMEEWLKKRINPDRHIEVLNTARGDSPTIYSFHVRQDVPAFKPNLVMVEIELVNDIGDEAILRFDGRGDFELPTSLRSARYIIAYRNKSRLTTLPLGVPALQRLKSISMLTQGFGFVLSWLLPSDVFRHDSGMYVYNLGFDQWLLTRESMFKAMKEMFVTLKGLQLFAKANGADFLLLILPSRFTMEEGPTYRFATGIVEEAIGEAIQRGIPYLSLTPVLKEAGGKDLFFDFCHPTFDGHRAIAEAVGSYLVSRYFPATN